MNPASLASADWFRSAATRMVMAALEDAGGAGCARFVGGCVRNTLLGRPVDDVDIATVLVPDEAMKALRGAGIKVIPTGMDHGTVTAVVEGTPYEITTLRRDVTTDGRRATVAFTRDWSEDAARRDFHINALYTDGTGEVFDPTGQGLADIAAHRVVFVGEAARRIEEDRLRILRFFRFHAWYGVGEPDATGLAACVDQAEGLKDLSAERVSKELMKLLAAPDPGPTLSIMEASGILGHLLPWPHSVEGARAMVAVTEDPVLRLSPLMPLDAEAVDQAARALRLSNRERERLLALTEPVLELAELTDPEVRALAYRLGKHRVQDRLVQALAHAPDRQQRQQDLGRMVDAWTVPRMPIGGRELAALGLEPGPETGEVLKAFEDSWIADDFPGSGHELRLKAVLDQRRS